jgi:hypothetical protein
LIDREGEREREKRAKLGLFNAVRIPGMDMKVHLR